LWFSEVSLLQFDHVQSRENADFWQKFKKQ